MTESKNNLIVKSLRGKIGDLVFRQSADIIGATARTQQNPVSLKKMPGGATLQLAVFYGKSAIGDFEAIKTYDIATTVRNLGYKIAIADFIYAPDIHEIDLSGYTGLPNQRIFIKVSAVFPVTSVSIGIQHEDGFLVENGNAIHDTEGENWIYTTKACNLYSQGDKIMVLATDMAEDYCPD